MIEINGNNKPLFKLVERKVNANALRTTTYERIDGTRFTIFLGPLHDEKGNVYYNEHIEYEDAIKLYSMSAVGKETIVDSQIKVVDEGNEFKFVQKVNTLLAEGFNISSTNVAVINTPNGHASVYQAILVWTAQENTVTMPLEKYEELLIKTIEIHEQKEMSEADKQKVIEKHLELNTKHVEKVLRDNWRRFETWENQT